MVSEKTRKKIIEKLNEDIEPECEQVWNVYNSAVIAFAEILIKTSEKFGIFSPEDFAEHIEFDVYTVLRMINEE